MNLTEMRHTIERGKALGLIHSPGQVKPVKLTKTETAAINGVRVAFMQIDSPQARAWLQHNLGNRRLRESTVQAYERDMRNGDWLLNHQGIAFDETGRLIDGQHRLEAIDRAGVTVTMLVSTGWPKRQTSKRNTTMDTVDRGLNRTVADQLGLQHGMTDARFAVSYTTVLLKLCAQSSKSNKLTTGLTLAVIDQFTEGLKFAVERRNNIQGLRSCGTLGAIAFAHRVHPQRVSEFYECLVTGVGLTKEHPVLHVRNWLMYGEGAKYISGSAHFYQASVVLNHIQSFCLNKPCEQIRTSQDGLEYFTKAQQKEVDAVKDLLA